MKDNHFDWSTLPTLLSNSSIIPTDITFKVVDKEEQVVAKFERWVAEVAREHRWHPPKSLDSDENFKPEHTLFCRELRFVAIYALFGDLWAKKSAFWGQITRKNDAFVAKIVNTF